LTLQDAEGEIPIITTAVPVDGELLFRSGGGYESRTIQLTDIPQQTQEIRVTIDNSGSVITGGTASTYIEKGCTLKAASIYADQAGEVTASLSRVRGTTTDYMGSVTLNGVTGVRDTTLIGWTSDLAIGDVLHVNWGGTLDAVTRATLTLRGEY